MRRSAFLCLALLALGLAASAQLSITPRIGVESFQTSLKYNDLSSYTPVGVYASPQASLRLDYRFLKMHGIFVGAATNRSTVSYQFSDPESGMNDFNAIKGDYRIRIETGYQFSSKPIFFGKSKASPTKNMTGNIKSSAFKSSPNCMSRCGHSPVSKSKFKNKSTYMRIEPFAGYSFVPGVKSNLSTKEINGASGYEYLAGNFNHAVTAGVDFEFGKGRHRFLVLGIQYLKGLGHMDPVVAEESSVNKSSSATLSSSASSWSLNIGIPIMLGGKHGYTKKAYHPGWTPVNQSKVSNTGTNKVYERHRCGGRKNLP